MTYRDDDEAARMRADALQHDLDDAQEELAETKRKLAAAEAARERLADEAARREPMPDPMPSPRVRSPLRREAVGWVIGGVAVTMVVLIVVAVTWRSSKRTYTPASTPDLRCVLQTDPPGATIVGRCYDEILGTDGETSLGTTPLTLPWRDWIDKTSTCKGGLLARKAGYRDTAVDVPLDTKGGCIDAVVPMQH